MNKMDLISPVRHGLDNSDSRQQSTKIQAREGA